jgi:hypothetical protein
MVALPAVLWLFAACLPGTGAALLPDEVDAGSVDLGGDSGLTRIDAALGDPFAIEGLSPSHGPFSGGTRSRIDGRGFSAKIRVFVGGVEVDGGALLASDPTRAAILLPPGPPGFVDVKIRDEVTASERVLRNGFYYDAFVVVPDNGATSGGTRIAITGSGTSWVPGTTVAIGGAPCESVLVSGPTKIECLTPVGTPGAKDVVISPPGVEALQARDAFTYSDSADGYRGGLSGGALAGRVKVLAYDSIMGRPVGGAYAIAGASIATARIARTAANGVIEIGDVPGDKVTVTVAAKCMSPVTFVDVPVDTVTVYLDPVLDPACGEGDPSPLPARQRFGGYIDGEVVFPGGAEFERANWTTVPRPTKPTERRAAYVFEASPNPTAQFVLPAAAQAITPDTDGANGFNYSLLVFPGNATIYVVAGLEDRSLSPPTFLPYSMGVARGVSVPSQGRVQGVDVKLDILFDHQVTIVAEPPPQGPRGPDRFIAQIAITLGAAGYAILPRGTRTSPLPTPGEIPFVGMPALDRALATEQYVLGGVAATGPNQQLPASLVTRVRTTNANTPVTLGGFLGVPIPVEPGAGTWSGRHVEIGVSGPNDIAVLHVIAGAGLMDWMIVAPKGTTSFDVPDLTALPPGPPDDVGKPGPGLLPGAIETTLYVARIEEFDYSRLRYGQLVTGAWAAFAYDRLGGVY